MRNHDNSMHENPAGRYQVKIHRNISVPILVLLAWTFASGSVHAGLMFCAETGHYYDVKSGPFNWAQAEADAKTPANAYQGVTGHLATITSAAENACVNDLVASGGPWVGGYQPPGTDEPDSGFRWVTTEPWGYANWNPGEPNDASSNEDCVQVGGDGGWNDLHCSAQNESYVIEWDIEDEGEAAFIVRKDFTDDNPAEVEVTLSCNTGLPLVQSNEISESQDVQFIVTDFDVNELDCEVTENIPNGYGAIYSDGYGSESETDCSWEDVGYQEFQCTITNLPQQVAVIFLKQWVIEGSNGHEIDARFDLTLVCDNQIQDFAQDNDGYWRWTVHGSDTGGMNSQASVTPDWDGGSDCWVEETVYDSSVEVDNDCQQGSLHIEIGEGASCVITNSVFYEGIPSLNQYGLAVLALLMLGVGLVGFWRMA